MLNKPKRAETRTSKPQEASDTQSNTRWVHASNCDTAQQHGSVKLLSTQEKSLAIAYGGQVGQSSSNQQTSIPVTYHYHPPTRYLFTNITQLTSQSSQRMEHNCIAPVKTSYSSPFPSFFFISKFGWGHQHQTHPPSFRTVPRIRTRIRHRPWATNLRFMQFQELQSDILGIHRITFLVPSSYTKRWYAGARMR
uniref:Uncharacterized protein n=1 Tax=Oryza brachyantha TaxID=4533 RepID=J3N2U5_ORYBR